MENNLAKQHFISGVESVLIDLQAVSYNLLLGLICKKAVLPFVY